MLRKRFIVAEGQKGLLYNNKQFEQVLEAGVHRFWTYGNDYEIRLVDTTGDKRVIEDKATLLLLETHADKFVAHVELWETSAEDIGLVYEQNTLKDIKLPGQRGAFWKGARELRVEKVNIVEDYHVDKRLASLMLGAESEGLRRAANNAIYAVTVPEGYVGFLNVDGKVEQTLTTGTYAWWKFSRVLKTQLLDVRLQNMEVNGQEILTKDKVSLRINLSATWQVEDANLVREKLADHNDYLYREMQLALRTVVSTQTLDQLLADKNLLNTQVQTLVAEKAKQYGINVKTVGARDIVLPGEMKTILAQVVEAEKLAEANLIRRREETQATRSLHNTAKVMEGNPVLLRLKELESLEKITARISTLNVYGGLEGVMNDTVKLTEKTKAT